MNEIRVINGLHRGVALPLDGDDIIIGSSLEADISLVDPGVAGEHIQIRSGTNLPPECWEMEVLDSNTKNEKGKKITGKITVRLNEKINIGGIWLLFSDEKEAWTCDSFPPEKKVVASKGKAHNSNFWVKIYCLAAGVLVGIVTLTHAGGDKPRASKKIEMSNELKALEQTGYLEKNVAVSHTTLKPTTSDNDLLVIFKKMLKERDLQAVALDVKPKHWTLTGDIAPYDYEKLIRMQARFNKKYKNSIKITNEVKKIEQSLPFSITRIVSGPMGHIEADDGYELYIGNEYKGFKLVGITNDTIMFSGKNTIAIKW